MYDFILKLYYYREVSKQKLILLDSSSSQATSYYSVILNGVFQFACLQSYGGF